MKSLIFIKISLCLLALVFTSASWAGSRVALVIGNSEYTHLKPLSNPKNDAVAVAKELQNLGFSFVRAIDKNQDAQLDLTLGQLIKAKRLFAQASQGADIALLYYAGHGVQLDGFANLLPVDVDKPEQGGGMEMFSRQTLGLGNILDAVGTGPKVRVAIFDACREVPELETMRGGLFDGGWRGLGRGNVSKGTIVAYSTEDGKLAADGAGRHSPYTNSLLSVLRTHPSVEIVDFFRVVASTMKDSVGQEPEISSKSVPMDTWSLLGEYQAPLATQEASSEYALEIEIWRAAEKDQKIASYEHYLEQYPKGKFVAFAKSKIADLKAKLSKARWYEPAMVKIPSGSFQMGDSTSDVVETAGPVHMVSLPSFWMSETEVTVKQFRVFIDATAYKTDAENNAKDYQGCYVFQEADNWQWRKGYSWRKPGFEQNDSHPVVCVSHKDAEAYVSWLSAETGKTYRLPSEAEWEYGARAGSHEQYSFGNEASDLCKYSNVADSTPLANATTWTGKTNCKDGNVYTAPVGSFIANKWGLKDVEGNAWEWVSDCWHDNYKSAPEDASSWGQENNGDCSLRVLRGGSWTHTPEFNRSSYRDRGGQMAIRSNYIGFRLARAD